MSPLSSPVTFQQLNCNAFQIISEFPLPVLSVAPKAQDCSSFSPAKIYFACPFCSTVSVREKRIRQTMFGRVRASPSSMDCFDSPPSKIFKDDPLSIYEATLMKLKQGSQRDLTPPPMDSMDMESDCTSENEAIEPTICSSINAPETSQNILSSSDGDNMVIDTESASSTSVVSSTSTCQSTRDSKQERSKNVSLVYMFSKYNSTRSSLNSSQGEPMIDSSEGSVVTCSSSSCVSAGSSTAV